MAKFKLLLDNFVPIMVLLIQLTVGHEEMNNSMLEEIPSIIADNLEGSAGEEISLFEPNGEDILKMDTFEVLTRERNPLANDNEGERIENVSHPNDDDNNDESERIENVSHPDDNENNDEGERIENVSHPDDNDNNDEVKVSGLGMELLRGVKELPGEFINKVSSYRDELHDTVEDYRDKLHDKVGDYRDKIHEVPKEVWNHAKEVPKKILNIPNKISKLWKKSPSTVVPDEERGSRNRGGLFGFGL